MSALLSHFTSFLLPDIAHQKACGRVSPHVTSVFPGHLSHPSSSRLAKEPSSKLVASKKSAMGNVVPYPVGSPMPLTRCCPLNGMQTCFPHATNAFTRHLVSPLPILVGQGAFEPLSLWVIMLPQRNMPMGNIMPQPRGSHIYLAWCCPLNGMQKCLPSHATSALPRHSTLPMDPHPIHRPAWLVVLKQMTWMWRKSGFRVLENPSRQGTIFVWSRHLLFIFIYEVGKIK